MNSKIVSCICSINDTEQVQDFLNDILCRSNILVSIVDKEDAVISSDIIIYVHSSNCISDTSVLNLLTVASHVNKTFIPIILGGNTVSNTYLKSRYSGPNLRTDFLCLNSHTSYNEFYEKIYAFSGLSMTGDAYGIDVIFKVDLDCKVYKDNVCIAELKNDENGQSIRCFPSTQVLHFQSTKYKELAIDKKINFKKFKSGDEIEVTIADYRTVNDWRFPDGRYSGSMYLEIRDGEGTMRYSDLCTYSGSWKSDMMHGKGILTFPDGRTYDGVWDSNILVKMKSFSWKEHGKYDGTFFGRVEGKSVTELRQNKWRDGMRHGNGKYKFPNGDVYVGEWMYDKFYGIGKMTFANGDSYDGSWKDGYMAGNGTYTCKMGKWKYVGEMKYNQPDGLGIKTWKDKSRYEGFFRRGNRSGKGVMHYSSGQIYDGQWENDNREGFGKLTWSNGDFYEGDFGRDVRAGYGTMKWKRKGKYIGHWYHDQMHGVGCREWKNGKRYEGDWRYNQRHGKGILYNKKGEIEFDGQWEEDKRMNWLRRTWKKISNY